MDPGLLSSLLQALTSAAGIGSVSPAQIAAPNADASAGVPAVEAAPAAGAPAVAGDSVAEAAAEAVPAGSKKSSAEIPQASEEYDNKQIIFDRKAYSRFRRRLQRSDLPDEVRKIVSTGQIREAYSMFLSSNENVQQMAEMLVQRRRMTSKDSERGFDWITQDQLREHLKCTQAQVELVWRERVQQGAVRKHPQAVK
jgi:hypothetical protein